MKATELHSTKMTKFDKNQLRLCHQHCAIEKERLGGGVRGRKLVLVQREGPDPPRGPAVSGNRSITA